MKKYMVPMLMVLLAASSLFAAEFEVTVTDGKGKPVENAVVALKSGVAAPNTIEAAPAQIIQKGKQFLPLVTVIQVGGKVEFPNQDSVQHHVYSFSKPKRFDIPLYKEATPKPVVCETPGVIVLGCNIHDWMKAFIYVADTPYVGKSGPDGVVNVSGLPAGTYQVELWHPRLKKILGTGFPKSVELSDAKKESVTVSLELKKEIAPPRTTGTDGGTYP